MQTNKQLKVEIRCGCNWHESQPKVKSNLWCPQFSQKTNVGIILCHVFWRIEDTIICFRDCLTFSEPFPNKVKIQFSTLLSNNFYWLVPIKFSNLENGVIRKSNITFALGL